MLLSHRDVIHLTPLASPIQGDPSTLLDYKYFRLELDFPEAQTQASGPEVQDLADAGHARPNSLRILVPSSKMGRLIGTGGSTIRQLKQDCQCDLETFPWGSFHPCAPSHYHGRTVQCSVPQISQPVSYSNPGEDFRRRPGTASPSDRTPDELGTCTQRAFLFASRDDWSRHTSPDRRLGLYG